MKINKLSTVFLCAAICAAFLTGCGEKKETSLSDNSYESTVSSVQTEVSSSTTASSQTEGGTSSNSSASSGSSSASSTVSDPSDPSSTPVQSTESSSQSSAQQSDVHSSSSVHSHEYTLTKTAAPTCAEFGYEVYTCSCGDQYAKDTDEALGHNYTKSVVAPTCTKNGYTLNTCTRCGQERMDDYTSALGHNNGSSKVVKPTCTQRGYTIHTCSRCGYEYKLASEEKAALGHSWGEWQVIKNATASSEGEQQRKCSRCGETDSKSIPQLKDESAYASEVVRLVNSERAKRGLSPLTARSDLNEYAQLRSTEIVSNFAHTRPDGSSPLNYVMGLNGIHASGENIAYGQSSPEAVMDAWMNSPGHCANILSSNYTMIGVGCYEYNGRLYWTQIFAG